MSKKVILIFPSEDVASDFCAYMSDGGGEYGFFEGQQSKPEVVSCDYSLCFPAWGYDPDKHGPDRTIVFQDEKMMNESKKNGN